MRISLKLFTFLIYFLSLFLSLKPISIFASFEALNPTRDIIYEKMVKQELKNDIKCWSTSKHIDEIFATVKLNGTSAHTKERIVKTFISQIWYTAQNLSRDKTILEPTDLEKAFSLIRKVNFYTDNQNNTLMSGINPIIVNNNISITSLDKADYRRTSSAWRILYSVATESSPVFLKSNLSEKAIDYLADIADLYSISLLKTSSLVAKFRNKTEIDNSILLNTEGIISNREYITDGWSLGDEYLEKAFAQSISYAKMKIENLQKFNGIAKDEDILKQYSNFSTVEVSFDVKIHLVQTLKNLARSIWQDAQKIGNSKASTDEVLVGGEDMYQAVIKVLPYKEDDLSNIIFFPYTKEPFIYQEFESNNFRDDAIHWKIIYELLDTEGKNSNLKNITSENKTLYPLDVYSAEELSEIISNYAVPLLKKAGAIARTQGQLKLTSEHIDLAHKYFLNHTRVFKPNKSISRDKNFSKYEWKGTKPIYKDVTKDVGIKAIENPTKIHDETIDGASLMAFDAFRGVAIGDINNDNYADIFIATENNLSKLYLNNKNGTFSDFTSETGVEFPSAVTGAQVIDYDNDGCKDLFLLRVYHPLKMYRGNCTGKLTDVSTELDFNNKSFTTTGAMWFDYNNDGYLDLYLLTTGDFKNGFLPAFGDVQNALPNQLFENVKGQKFINVTEKTNTGDKRISLASSFSDFNNDGLPDFYIANDMQPNSLYISNKDNSYTNLTKEAGVNDFGNGMGVSIADFNSDGLMDIFLTNISLWNPRTSYIRPIHGTKVDSTKDKDKYIRTLQANRLYQNLGNLKFKDVTDQYIGNIHTGWGWNGFFFDFDNDGDSDIYVTNGFRPESLMNHDEEKVLLVWDEKRKHYFDISKQSGANFRSNSRGSAFFDFNKDGQLDLILTGLHSPVVFQNINKNSNNWLSVKLIGTKSNRDAFGARVTIKTNKGTQIKEMGNQGGGFISSINDNLHFGLGKNEKVRNLLVKWPSGKLTELKNVNVNQEILLAE